MVGENRYNIGTQYEAGIVHDEQCVDCGDHYSFGMDWYATATDGPRTGFICEGCAVRHDPQVSDFLSYLREFIVDPGPAQYLMEKIEFGLRAPTLPT